MGIIESIGQGLRAIAEVFGWASKRSDLNNTPAMVANAVAKTRQEIADKVNADISKGDLDAERKDAAE